MSDFAPAWLRLRESADLAARDPTLARNFAATLRNSRPTRIVDLASGSGANARALLPRIAGDQEWILIDRDRALLAAQSTEFTTWARRQGYPITGSGGRIAIDARPAQWRLEAMPLDLLSDFESLGEIEADGFTAAAFFDLVSAPWLNRCVTVIAARRVPLLAVLTVDGRRDWQPRLAEDSVVSDAFARHQRRDKGFGPALGGAAQAILEKLLCDQGYKIERAASDWRLGAGKAALLDVLIDAEAVAAREAAPDAAATIAAWAEQRHEQLAARDLSLVVGHCDLLALPA